MKQLIIGLVVISLLAACGKSAGSSNQLSAKQEDSNFVLEVRIDKPLSPGEELKIHSTLTYRGKEKINLRHGEPVIRTKVIDTSTGSVVEPMMYTAVITETAVEPADTFTDERNVEIQSAGTYEVEVTTTALFQEDNPLGKVSIDPVSFEVN